MESEPSGPPLEVVQPEAYQYQQQQRQSEAVPTPSDMQIEPPLDVDAAGTDGVAAAAGSAVAAPVAAAAAPSTSTTADVSPVVGKPHPAPARKPKRVKRRKRAKSVDSLSSASSSTAASPSPPPRPEELLPLPVIEPTLTTQEGRRVYRHAPPAPYGPVCLWPKLSADQLAKYMGPNRVVNYGEFYYEVYFEPLPEPGTPEADALHRLRQAPPGSAGYARGPDPHIRIGWATYKAHDQAPVGFDVHGYSIRDADGAVVHNATRRPYGLRGFGPGDVLGVWIRLPADPRPRPVPPPAERDYFDSDEDGDGAHLNADTLLKEQTRLRRLPGSAIAFFCNGECLGPGPEQPAFTDIYAGTYYPAVSCYYGAAVQVNFGAEPFRYRPGRLPFRALAELVVAAPPTPPPPPPPPPPPDTVPAAASIPAEAVAAAPVAAADAATGPVAGIAATPTRTTAPPAPSSPAQPAFDPPAHSSDAMTA